MLQGGLNELGTMHVRESIESNDDTAGTVSFRARQSRIDVTGAADLAEHHGDSELLCGGLQLLPKFWKGAFRAADDGEPRRVRHGLVEQLHVLLTDPRHHARQAGDVAPLSPQTRVQSLPDPIG